MDDKISGHTFWVPALNLMKLSPLRWGPSIFPAGVIVQVHLVILPARQFLHFVTQLHSAAHHPVTPATAGAALPLAFPCHALRESQM